MLSYFRWCRRLDLFLDRPNSICKLQIPVCHVNPECHGCQGCLSDIARRAVSGIA